MGASPQPPRFFPAGAPAVPRPQKLDDEKKRRLIELVMNGASVASAARSVGCTSRTVERAALRDEPFAWRLNIARDSRDAALQLALEERGLSLEAADPAPETFRLSEQPSLAELAAALTEQITLLWHRDTVHSTDCPACRCDKTVTRAAPTT